MLLYRNVLLGSSLLGLYRALSPVCFSGVAGKEPSLYLMFWFGCRVHKSTRTTEHTLTRYTRKVDTLLAGKVEARIPTFLSTSTRVVSSGP